MIQTKLFALSPEPWKPHAYQKRAVKWLLEHAAAALFLDPGLGKTSIALAAWKMLKAMDVASRALVVAPLRVAHEVWPAEAEKWIDFQGLTVAVLHGPHKAELFASDADVCVINPEGLEWLLGIEKTKTQTGRTRVAVDLRRWKSFGFDTLIVDELSKFKHIQTQRFKALKQVLPSFARRWGLTGSPAANGLIDLFGQCYILDTGRSLGPYITHYRMKYFTPSYDGFSWTLRDGADKEIYARLKPLALRMSAEDYLEVPAVVETRIMVDLPKSARRVYDALEDDLLARIDDKTVVAANAAAASTKCRQVANGGVYLTPDIEAFLAPRDRLREWVDLHTAKVDAVADLIEELQGQPLLVAYDFEHDLARLRAKLGKTVPYLGGGVSTTRMREVVCAWNAGELPVLLVQPQTVAHGLNLQGADAAHIVFHSLTWNYEHDDQLIRRLRRQGNKAARIFVYRVVAKDTVDEAILGALRSKQRGQQALFEALRLRVYKRRRLS